MADDLLGGSMDRRAALKALGGAGLAALGAPAMGSAEAAGDRLANVLPSFRAESRAILQRALTPPSFSGQIAADVVRELAASEKKSLSELMVGLLPLARMYSHPPISNYRVGIVARGESGALYPGFNVEIPGQALGFAVHGEQAALSSAYMHGEAGVASIALTAAPCGHCRQFMNEMSPEGEIEVLVEGEAAVKLSALLPRAFGPKDLGRKEGAFPVRETELSAATEDAVARAAVVAARRSYAPYSGAHSGVGIGTKAGRIFSGAYLENVAFNPSLSPLQTALVQMILAGEEYGAIARVVLAESGRGKISQRAVTEAVLGEVAAGVRVEVLNLGG